MKHFIFNTILIGALCVVSCAKAPLLNDNGSYYPSYPSGSGGEDPEYVHEQWVICCSTASRGPVTNPAGGVRLARHEGDPLTQEEVNVQTKFDFGRSPAISITNLPEGVQASFETENGVTVPKIYLEDAFGQGENGRNLEFSVAYQKNGETRNENWRLKIVRPDFSVTSDYVYDKDSVYFLPNGKMYEHASTHTNSFMDTYLSGYEYSSITTNCLVRMTASDEWISPDCSRAKPKITVSANEGPRRVGYVTFSDLGGDKSVTLKIIQEGTDFKQRQYEVLMELYNALGGPNWKYNNNWGNYDELYNPSGGWDSGWSGIGVNSEGYVTEISLISYNLSGRIPESIGDLWHLYELKMNNNSITGPIPAGIGKLGCLDTIDLSDNQLTGNFPETMKNMYRLRSLAFEKNNLSGNIPDWMPSGLPRYPYSNMSYYMYNNYWRNYSHEKHCSGSYDYHDYDKYGKTPDGFEYGGSSEINF